MAEMLDVEVLGRVKERSLCPGCGSSKMYFCYRCVLLLPPLRNQIPIVELPISVDIVRHPKEKLGKGTGIQAALLAPNSTKLYTFPEFPNYSSSHSSNESKMFLKRLHGSVRSFCSKKPLKILAPKTPFVKEIDRSKMPPPPRLSQDLVDHLERQSLVRFSNEAALHHLEKAIVYADELRTVDTKGVEPMDSVLENGTLRLRSDEVTQGNCKEEVMKNARKRVEDYFVTPPGNVPFEERIDKLGVVKAMKKKI